jgi:hypothetical protein
VLPRKAASSSPRRAASFDMDATIQVPRTSGAPKGASSRREETAFAGPPIVVGSGRTGSGAVAHAPRRRSAAGEEADHGPVSAAMSSRTDRAK